jgi:predicted dehydrogenase
MVLVQISPFASVSSHINFPDQVFIIGGGRWARVIAKVVCDLLPTDMPVTVCSSRGATALTTWSEEHGLDGRIAVAQKWPETFPSRRTAVIVANAARDHIGAGLWALERGASVLIEKPFALSLRDAQRLADCAIRHGRLLAAAHVLHFTRYLENFSRTMPEWENISSIDLEWVDPLGERRCGEAKQYDSSVPVFADCLPHAVSALQSVFGLLPELAGSPTVEDGGSRVALPLMLGGRPCCVYLQRNGSSRLRRMSVKTSNGLLNLDFSVEPGVIWLGSQSICADSCWDHAERPLASLLGAFLTAAAGESIDSRLSLDAAFTACAIADAVMADYRATMTSWLSDYLSSGKEFGAAVRYALIERLQIDERLPKIELEGTEVLVRKYLRDT